MVKTHHRGLRYAGSAAVAADEWSARRTRSTLRGVMSEGNAQSARKFPEIA